MRKYLRLSLALLGLTPDYFDDQPILNNEIDFYLQNATITQFNKNGSIDYVLISPKIEHFKITDITKVNLPNIKSNYNQQEWHINSNYAQILNYNNQIEFFDNVLVNNNNDLSVTTNSLSLYPKQEYATTNDVTTIIQDNNKVIADNLNLNLKDSTLILNKVKAEYENYKTP